MDRDLANVEAPAPPACSGPGGVAHELLATALEAYDIGEKLGRGGCGIVLAGRHRGLGQRSRSSSCRCCSAPTVRCASASCPRPGCWPASTTRPAAEHFQDAGDRAGGVGAIAQVTLAQREHARMLLRGGGARDREQAAALLDEAFTGARRHELAGVAESLLDLQAREHG